MALSLESRAAFHTARPVILPHFAFTHHTVKLSPSGHFGSSQCLPTAAPPESEFLGRTGPSCSHSTISCWALLWAQRRSRRESRTVAPSGSLGPRGTRGAAVGGRQRRPLRPLPRRPAARGRAGGRSAAPVLPSTHLHVGSLLAAAWRGLGTQATRRGQAPRGRWCLRRAGGHTATPSGCQATAPAQRGGGTAHQPPLAPSSVPHLDSFPAPVTPPRGAQSDSRGDGGCPHGLPDWP